MFRKMASQGLLLLCSFATYFLSYFVVRKCVRKCSPKTLTEGDIYDISVKFVSMMYGIASCCVGYVIITSVNDIIHDTHWLTECSIWLAAPYFPYDLWAMYQPFYLDNPGLHHKPLSQRFSRFLLSQPLMSFHHIGLPLLFFPCAAFLRNNKGDYFIGCFYFFELAVPFIASRNILVRLKMKESKLYLVNGVIMITVFFVCRVAIFPFMYWSYARYRGISMWQVALYIPAKCSVGCFLLLSLMIYWLIIMLKVALKTIRKRQNQCPIRPNGSVIS